MVPPRPWRAGHLESRAETAGSTRSSACPREGGRAVDPGARQAEPSRTQPSPSGEQTELPCSPSPRGSRCASPRLRAASSADSVWRPRTPTSNPDTDAPGPVKAHGKSGLRVRGRWPRRPLGNVVHSETQGFWYLKFLGLPGTWPAQLLWFTDAVKGAVNTRNQTPAC